MLTILNDVREAALSVISYNIYGSSGRESSSACVLLMITYTEHHAYNEFPILSLWWLRRVLTIEWYFVYLAHQAWAGQKIMPEPP